MSDRRRDPRIPPEFHALDKELEDMRPERPATPYPGVKMIESLQPGCRLCGLGFGKCPEHWEDK